jgi:hypothetical protein
VMPSLPGPSCTGSRTRVVVVDGAAAARALSVAAHGRRVAGTADGRRRGDSRWGGGDAGTADGAAAVGDGRQEVKMRGLGACLDWGRQ